MSVRVALCRPRFGPMSKLIGIWRFLAMSMSRRDVIKKVCDSGPCSPPTFLSPFFSSSLLLFPLLLLLLPLLLLLLSFLLLSHRFTCLLPGFSLAGAHPNPRLGLPFYPRSSCLILVITRPLKIYCIFSLFLAFESFPLEVF